MPIVEPEQTEHSATRLVKSREGAEKKRKTKSKRTFTSRCSGPAGRCRRASTRKTSTARIVTRCAPTPTPVYSPTGHVHTADARVCNARNECREAEKRAYARFRVRARAREEKRSLLSPYSRKREQNSPPQRKYGSDTTEDADSVECFFRVCGASRGSFSRTYRTAWRDLRIAN